jgi:hypothetical protein
MVLRLTLKHRKRIRLKQIDFGQVAMLQETLGNLLRKSQLVNASDVRNRFIKKRLKILKVFGRIDVEKT